MWVCDASRRESTLGVVTVMSRMSLVGRKYFCQIKNKLVTSS